MNLSAAVQQLEIPVSELKAICQALDIAVTDNSISDDSFQKVQAFVIACKERACSFSEGIQELLRLKNEAQAQQQTMGTRFNLDEFFRQRIGIDPQVVKPGSYHYDLYQLLLKSHSISQVGYTLFREAFLRQTQDLILNGVEESEITHNQTVNGFGAAFESIEHQFEQNFLGTSVNWGEQEHPVLVAAQQTSLPGAKKTTTSTSHVSKK